LTAYTLKGDNPRNEKTEVNDFDSKYFDLDSLANKSKPFILLLRSNFVRNFRLL